MTLDTKLTMALAGCSGSCSANRWHALSVALPCFRATNPKTLQRDVGSGRQLRRGPNPGLVLPPPPGPAPWGTCRLLRGYGKGRATLPESGT